MPRHTLIDHQPRNTCWRLGKEAGRLVGAREVLTLIMSLIMVSARGSIPSSEGKRPRLTFVSSSRVGFRVGFRV